MFSFNSDKKLVALKKELDKTKAENGRLTERSESEDTRKANKIGNLNDKIVNLEKVEVNLKNDIADLNAKKKREEELIKHNTKIIIEKHEIELDKKLGELTREQETAIAKVKDEYRDKIEKQLEARGTEMKEMYTDVLTKLTGVTGTVASPAKRPRSESGSAGKD